MFHHWHQPLAQMGGGHFFEGHFIPVHASKPVSCAKKQSQEGKQQIAGPEGKEKPFHIITLERTMAMAITASGVKKADAWAFVEVKTDRGT